jgi:hypothetical protein
LETVTLPKPQVGLVVRYSYLWSHEAEAGRDEGVKDRPCAIILMILREGRHPVVRVLPVTHSAPLDAGGALEIPPLTKKRLGLDGERSWVILDEANDFVWPGPDLRPVVPGDWATATYGMLPKEFMKALGERLLARVAQKKTKAVRRSE